MRVWRISNYADLSGVGGKYKAGRWNEIGRLIVYCADHPALALLEVLVHFDPEDLPDSYRLLEINLPDSLITDTPRLPENWKDNEAVSRTIFEGFCVDAKTPGLRVPSALVPHSSNILLNPHQPQIGDVRIVSVTDHPLDRRFRT